MAEEKSGILVYADWIDKFEDMSDEEAGMLIKHFFRYVNDLDPIAPNRIIKMAFHDIEKTLKRDLKKWEAIKVKRSEAGKASAEAKKLAKETEQTSTKSTHVESVQQTSTKSTVSVNVSDSVNVIVNDDDDNIPSSSFIFFTIKDFEDQISIGENEFTLLAVRQTKLNIMQLKILLADFINTQKSLTANPWKNVADAKKHFIAWVNKQPKQQGITIQTTN